MQRIEVVVVGTGRVGSALLLSLKKAKLSAVAISRSKVGSYLDLPVFSFDSPSLPLSPDFLLIAVPDREVSTTARRLCERIPLRDETLIGHLCGSLPSTAIDCLAQERVFSAHPLRSFPLPSIQSCSLDGVLVTVEAPSKHTLERVMDLFQRLGARPVPMSLEARPLYHAAASLAANLAPALVLVASRLFAMAKIPDPEEEATLLFEQAMENMARGKRVNAITGPVARGDIRTIASHFQALKKVDQRMAEAYAAVSKLLANLLRGEGILEEGTWKEIERTLKG